MCYLETGQRVTSYGHISCNLIICLGIGEDTPMFVGHAYSNNVDRIRKYSDIECIMDACPEIFEAFLFARELRNSNITPYLLTVGEVTSIGKTFASLVMDRLEGLSNNREFVFSINHINPYLVHPDTDSFDITVTIERPYLDILVDFHTPHFAVQSIPYSFKI